MTALLYRPAVDDTAAEGMPLFVVTVRVRVPTIIVDTFVLNKSITDVRESLSVDSFDLRNVNVSPFIFVDVCVSVITTVVVRVTVVLWIEVLGKLVVKVEIGTNVRIWVTVDNCVKAKECAWVVDPIPIFDSMTVVEWMMVVDSMIVVGWVVTCVVVLTSEMVVAGIEEGEVNSVLIKVVGITSVETSVVAKGVKSVKGTEFGGEGSRILFMCSFLMPKTVASTPTRIRRKTTKAI
jgi:hypothetical protein